MVEQQPIGKALFGEWCDLKGSEYHRCFLLLNVAKQYEVETDDQRHELVSIIKQVMVDQLFELVEQGKGSQ